MLVCKDMLDFYQQELIFARFFRLLLCVHRRRGTIFSQVPKRVVSKRVVLADVPLYRHFIFFNFLVFLRFGSSALSPSPEEGDPDQVFSLN